MHVISKLIVDFGKMPALQADRGILPRNVSALAREARRKPEIFFEFLIE